jgi:hypothetical protein
VMAGRTRLGVLRAAVGVAIASGALIGVLLGASIAQLNDWGLGRDAVLVAAYLAALYAAVIGVGLVACALGLLALGRRPGPRVFWGLSLAFVLLLSGSLRYIPSVQLFSVVPHMTAIGVLDATVLLAAALLLVIGIGAARGGRLVLTLGLAAALLLGLETLHRRHERPLVRDLTEAVPEALAGGEVADPEPAAERLDNAKLVILGFDCLSWEVLLPLLRRGELPNFRALTERAAYGQLETSPFAISPVVWETIATGQPQERHGIGYHTHFEFPGVSERVRHLPHFRLTNSPVALRRMLAKTSPFAPWRQVPADATDARAARLWEIADRAGFTVGVYDWMNTTPVAPVRGFVHGYGSIPPIVFPPGLEDDLPPLPDVPVDAADHGRLLSLGLARERATYEHFRALALRFQPQILMYYTHFADAVNHLSWKQETVGDRLVFAAIRHPVLHPGPEITRATHFLDEIVGDVLARIPREATIAIVSDHGFDFRGYEHDNGPPGVLLLAGPGVRPGLVTGASIYDVTPTLLHLLGLPVADDMAGAPLPIARPGGPLDTPPRRIASYGPAATPLEAGVASEKALEEHEAYLRALGYVN